MTRQGCPGRVPGSARRVGLALRDTAAGLLLLWPLLVGWSFFDPFHEHVEKGNRTAEAGEAEQAIEQYDEASRVDPANPIPDYNRGVVRAREGDAEGALDAFRRASAAGDASLAADALFNEGNVHLESQEFEPAIDSYLKSLDLAPTDPDARRNLEIALQRLQEQQQQQQQQQDQQEQDDQDQDQEEQQEQQPQDPEDDQQPQDEEPSQQDEPSPDEPETPEDQQPQPQEDQLSREDAERLLNAVQSDELKTLEQMQERPAQPGVVINDW